jgi:hypothetical protein
LSLVILQRTVQQSLEAGVLASSSLIFVLGDANINEILRFMLHPTIIATIAIPQVVFGRRFEGNFKGI